MDAPDEGVNPSGLNIVQLLDSLFDLTLICLNVNNENERIMFLDLLHCGFRVQRPKSRRATPI